MKFRSTLITTFAVAGLALSPAKAHAVVVTPTNGFTTTPCTPGPSTGLYSLGLGGYLSGCWGSLNVSSLFENAGDISSMYWFGAPLVLSGNAPTSSNTFMFNDDATSPGSAGSGKYFAGTYYGFARGAGNPASITQNISWLTYSPELVFGLQDPTSGWVYSGSDPARNVDPSPAGLQNFLIQITDVGDGRSHFLFGWEDLNSGCLTSSSGTTTTVATVVSASALNSLFATCTGGNTGGISDRDYNDFYVLIDAETLGTPRDVIPEPMTMTLLATGLVGLGGASLRKRNKKS
jgi:hypothetical protein